MKQDVTKNKNLLYVLVLVFMEVLLELDFASSRSYAGGMIQFDEHRWISVGFGVKSQFTAAENGSADGQSYSKDFSINNALLYINGRLAKSVGFMINTECFNCAVLGGGSAFGGNSQIGIVDALARLEFNQYVNFWIGRMLVTGQRSEMTGPFYNGAFDTFKLPFPSTDFSTNFGPGGAGLYNRDHGVTFFGRVSPGFGHLQYAVGVFMGLRPAENAGPNNHPGHGLYVGRLTYNFLNPEENPGYYTSSTYLGEAGDILAIAVSGSYQKSGAGSFDHRSDYTTLTADLLFEKPFGNNMDKGVFTYYFEWIRYWAQYNNAAFEAPIGDCFCMFRGQAYTTYGMYMFPQVVGIGKLQPYGRYTFIQPDHSTNRSEVEVGVNYLIDGISARLSVYWQYGDLETVNKLNYAPGVELGNKFSAFRVGLQYQY